MIKSVSEALKDCYSAYTFQELSDILPWAIEKEGYWYYLFIHRLENIFYVKYLYYESLEYEGYESSSFRSFKNKNYADAMAEMACYLKDEGIIK